MRLLVLVDTYVPARISAALQMHDFCRELVAQGHEPTVVVPAPELDAPTRRERVDGVDVLRVRAPRTKDIGHVRRALAEATLSLVLRRGIRASALRTQRWDGVVWYSPSIFLGPLARHLMRRDGCQGYLILRDLFPDWAVDAGLLRRGLAWRVFKNVERYQYRVATVIGVQTPANVALVARDAPPGARIEVLNNWLAEPRRAISRFDVGASTLAGRTLFVYAGNMGAAQGMDILLDLARELRDDPAVGFVFIGRGSETERLRARARDEHLSNVLFVDEVAADEIPAILEHAHVGLIALDPRHTTHNIPGKFITYLRAGLPVLARVNAGNDLQGVIDQEGVGRAVGGDDLESLVRHARELASEVQTRDVMSARARALAQRDYSPAGVVAQVIAGLQPPRA